MVGAAHCFRGAGHRLVVGLSSGLGFATLLPCCVFAIAQGPTNNSFDQDSRVRFQLLDLLNVSAVDCAMGACDAGVGRGMLPAAKRRRVLWWKPRIVICLSSRRHVSVVYCVKSRAQAGAPCLRVSLFTISGYGGVTCKDCIKGYYRLEDKCAKCPSAAYMLIFVYAFAIGKWSPPAHRRAIAERRPVVPPAAAAQVIMSHLPPSLPRGGCRCCAWVQQRLCRC